LTLECPLSRGSIVSWTLECLLSRGSIVSWTLECPLLRDSIDPWVSFIKRPLSVLFHKLLSVFYQEVSLHHVLYQASKYAL
jgi:hypothetical protein